MIGAALAANFGATTGIDVPAILDATGQAGLTNGQLFRVVGAVVYFLGLIVAVFIWQKLGWKTGSDEIVRTIPEQARMLIGVVAGGLALAFALK